jgi:hypothetical protein
MTGNDKIICSSHTEHVRNARIWVKLVNSNLVQAGPFTDQNQPHKQNDVFYFFNWYGGGVESNWVHSALRPPIWLLCQPRVIMMEKLVEWVAGETEVLGKKTYPNTAFRPQTPHAARTRTRTVAVGRNKLHNLASNTRQQEVPESLWLHNFTGLWTKFCSGNLKGRDQGGNFAVSRRKY